MPPSADFRWFFRLRLAAVPALAAGTLAACLLLNAEKPGFIGACLWATAFISLLPGFLHPTRSVALFCAVADTLLLTAFLALAGGPANPCTALYFVQVVCVAAALGGGFGFLFAALTTAAYAALFAWNRPLLNEAGQVIFASQSLPVLHTHGGFAAHIHAEFMRHLHLAWMMHAGAAFLLAGFMHRLLADRKAGERREVEIRAAADRFAALAAMAAGAAHEIATPLASIALAAREIEQGAGGRAADDARLILVETARCRAVLDAMDPEGARGRAPWAQVRTALARRFGARLCIESPEVVPDLGLSPLAAERILGNLVKNALDAVSDKPARLALEYPGQGLLRLRIEDDGPGLPPEILGRAGTPFFTTKAPGEGMGLGLFVARLLAQRAGGSLHLTNRPGGGAQALLEIPPAP